MSVPRETIRPALDRAETKLILEALDDLSVASTSLDKMDEIRDLKVRLRSAANGKGWYDVDA
jgi:hypothetical protein